MTCDRCCRKIMEEELEEGMIVQWMRKHDIEVRRENYIRVNRAGCKIRPWTAEHEDELPMLLQDWDRFYKNAKRRDRRRATKFPRPALAGLRPAGAAGKPSGLIRKFLAREGKFSLEKLGAPDARTLPLRPLFGVYFVTAVGFMLGLVLAIYSAFGPVACQNRIVNLKNRTLSFHRTHDEVVNPPS